MSCERNVGRKNWVQFDEPTKQNNMWKFCLVLFHNTHVCHFIGRNHLPKINMLSLPRRLENLKKIMPNPRIHPVAWDFGWCRITNNIKFNSTWIYWEIWILILLISLVLCFCQISNNLLHFNPLAKGCTWLVLAHSLLYIPMIIGKKTSPQKMENKITQKICHP